MYLYFIIAGVVACSLVNVVTEKAKSSWSRRLLGALVIAVLGLLWPLYIGVWIARDIEEECASLGG